jgi:hypothetical protein
MVALSAVAVNYTSAAVEALLTIIIAGVFVVIGYVIAKVINMFVTFVFDKTDLQGALRKTKLHKLLGGYTVTQAVTMLVSIYLPLLFLAQATTIRSLGVFTEVIKWILWYIPNLVAGVIVLMAALLLAEHLSDIVRKESSLQVANIAGKVVQVFIVYVAVVFTLPMILPGANVAILEEAFRWLLVAVAVAFGFGFAIALGLGFKDSFALSAKKNQHVFDELFTSVHKK